MVRFMERWFGKGRVKWYLGNDGQHESHGLAEGEIHPLYRDNEEGRELREVLMTDGWEALQSRLGHRA